MKLKRGAKHKKTFAERKQQTVIWTCFTRSENKKIFQRNLGKGRKIYEKQQSKKVISLFLVLIMAVSLLPMAGLVTLAAADDDIWEYTDIYQFEMGQQGRRTGVV